MVRCVCVFGSIYAGVIGYVFYVEQYRRMLDELVYVTRLIEGLDLKALFTVCVLASIT